DPPTAQSLHRFARVATDCPHAAATRADTTAQAPAPDRSPPALPRNDPPPSVRWNVPRAATADRSASKAPFECPPPPLQSRGTSPAFAPAPPESPHQASCPDRALPSRHAESAGSPATRSGARNTPPVAATRSTSQADGSDTAGPPEGAASPPAASPPDA